LDPIFDKKKICKKKVKEESGSKEIKYGLICSKFMMDKNLVFLVNKSFSKQSFKKKSLFSKQNKK